MSGPHERDFKGIWIPREIWLDKDLTIIEKMFLVEIDSLSRLEKGCVASNSHFAEFFSLSKGRCTQVVKSLESKGYLSITLKREKGVIKERRLRVVNKLNRVFRKLNGGSENSKRGYLENAQGNNTKHNNTEDQEIFTSKRPDPDPVKNAGNQTSPDEPETLQADLVITDPPDSHETWFDAWWAIYPRKTAKLEARKVWGKSDLEKRGPELVAEIRNRVTRDRTWVENIRDGRLNFIMGPDRYLRNERWDDEIDPIDITKTTDTGARSNERRPATGIRASAQRAEEWYQSRHGRTADG